MSNPYEAPKTPGVARPDGPAKVTAGAYVLAVISGLFVTFGSMLVAAFSPMFLGNWTAHAPRPFLALIPVAAVGLGLLSAWQSIRQAKRKAAAR